MYSWTNGISKSFLLRSATKYVREGGGGDRGGGGREKESEGSERGVERERWNLGEGVSERERRVRGESERERRGEERLRDWREGESKKDGSEEVERGRKRDVRERKSYRDVLPTERVRKGKRTVR